MRKPCAQLKHTHMHNSRGQLQLSGMVKGMQEGSDGAYRKDTAINYFMGVITTKERKSIPIQKNSGAF